MEKAPPAKRATQPAEQETRHLHPTYNVILWKIRPYVQRHLARGIHFTEKYFN